MKLVYPNMRDELLAELESFAMPDLEERGGYHYDSRWVGAAEMVSELPGLQGRRTPADAEKLIGYMLYDEEEAQAVGLLIAAIDVLFTQVGRPASDADYVSAPGWRGVVEAAANAREALGRRK